MKRKAAAEYVVEVNGTPDYAKIPKPVLESVAKKFLENILKRQKENDEGLSYGRDTEQQQQTCLSVG